MKKIVLFILAILTGIEISNAQISEQDFQEMLSEINADSIRATVQDMQNFSSRFALHGNKDVADYVIARLQQYGVTNAIIDSFQVNVDYNWLAGGAIHRYMYNVKGTLEGSSSVDSTVILGSHLDCITANSDYSIIYDTTAGADDNASGIAVMLEVARVCHNHQLIPRLDIDFMAYDGEEFGLYGSQYDAQQRIQNQDKILLMLNNDMVANDPNNQGLMNIFWYDNSMQERSNASLMCDNFTTLTPVIFDIAGNGLSHNSDSYAYYLQGFHAVFAMENEISPYYHGPLDVTAQYNYNYAAEVAKMNLAMLIHYSCHNVFSLSEDIENYTNTIQAPAIFPNPTYDQTTLSYYLNNNEDVTISLLNISGQQLVFQKMGLQTSGLHHTQLNVGNLSRGIYFCKIQTSNGSKTVKLIKK